MKQRVVIVDTSILAVWLRIPGFDDAGPDHLTFEDIDANLKREIQSGTVLMLVAAVIIETGNHIAQIKDGTVRRKKVESFADFLDAAAESRDGWKIYYNAFLNKDKLLELTSQWRGKGVLKLSFGDASILKTADELKPLYDVDVFTADQQLKSMSAIPATPVYAPKQRRNRR